MASPAAALRISAVDMRKGGLAFSLRQGASCSKRRWRAGGRRHACITPRAQQQQRQAMSGPNSGAQSPTQQLMALRQELTEAVQQEEYTRAAELRDQIRQLEVEDPVSRLQRELEAAVQEERYEEAADLRDQLAALRPPPPRSDVPATSSAVTTEGVEVVAQSYFSPSQSLPEHSSYLFRYQITINNNSNRTVKVMERYWLITNAHGNTKEVRGPGVVGQQPELPPGASFSYESACPLATPTGTMEGHLEVYIQKEQAPESQGRTTSGPWTQSLLVQIGRFGLNAESA